MTIDITTIMNYMKDDKVRPYNYLYNRTDAERKANPQHKSDILAPNSKTEVLVKDARLLNKSLETDGFQLIKQHTSLSYDDFYNSEKIFGTYYMEMVDAIKNHTGAAHVEVVFHQIRNRTTCIGGIENAKNYLQDYTDEDYGVIVHADFSAQSAEAVFKSMASKEYERGRFMLINCWRNISNTPIGDNHLAVLDERSLIKPDDYITSEVHTAPAGLMEHRDTPNRYYRLWDRNAAQHRWYYFSKMRRDELLLFKNWDSDATSPVRHCFHSSFKDPNAKSNTPPRESIELKVIAFFPNHEPNTCPTLDEEKECEPSAEKITEDENIITNGVDKIISAIDRLDAWPAPGKMMIKGLYAGGHPGAKKIAEMLSRDSTGKLGLRNLSKEQKEKIVSEIMKQGRYFQRLRINVEKLGRSSAFTGFAFNLSEALMFSFGSMIGWMVCTLLRERIQEQDL